MCIFKPSYLCAYTQGLGSSSFPKRPEPILEKWEQHPPPPTQGNRLMSDGQQPLTSKRSSNLC